MGAAGSKLRQRLIGRTRRRCRCCSLVPRIGAGAEETVGCGCMKQYRINMAAEVLRGQKVQGGKMPVNSGFLRNSSVVSTEGPPDGTVGDPALVFSTVELGQTVWAGWTAAYALRMEHGVYGEDSLGRVSAQPRKGFMRSAT